MFLCEYGYLSSEASPEQKQHLYAQKAQLWSQTLPQLIPKVLLSKTHLGRGLGSHMGC